jgi:hypothetical protein
MDSLSHTSSPRKTRCFSAVVGELSRDISALWRRYSWFESMRGSQLTLADLSFLPLDGASYFDNR